jgi:hypothetical protein
MGTIMGDRADYFFFVGVPGGGETFKFKGVNRSWSFLAASGFGSS